MHQDKKKFRVVHFGHIKVLVMALKKFTFYKPSKNECFCRRFTYMYLVMYICIGNVKLFPISTVESDKKGLEDLKITCR